MLDFEATSGMILIVCLYTFFVNEHVLPPYPFFIFFKFLLLCN